MESTKRAKSKTKRHLFRLRFLRSLDFQVKKLAADAAATASSSVTEEEMTLTVKWSCKEYTVRVCGDDSVAELKRRICQLTNVLPERQKLFYPKIDNKLSDDSLLLSQLPPKSSFKMTMIGQSSLSLSLIKFLFNLFIY